MKRKQQQQSSSSAPPSSKKEEILKSTTKENNNAVLKNGEIKKERGRKEEEHDWRAAAKRKPKLRGISHMISFIISLYLGYILVINAPEDAKLSVTVYVMSVSGLFGISGFLHFPTWSPTQRRIIGKLDHSMIFFLIAGSYTGIFSIVKSSSNYVIIVTWIAALFGTTSKLVWFGSQIPKYFVALPYILTGWSILIDAPKFLLYYDELGLSCVILLALGGIVYTSGGIMYALKRPALFPKIFGYHELFHLCVIIGVYLHYSVVYIHYVHCVHNEC